MSLKNLELPLFPLGNVVLFPSMPLPLQIFEERYKQMIWDIGETEPRFGVVLIKQGREVGPTAVPYSIGTVAKIVQLERVEDGRIMVSAVGEQRFVIQETQTGKPYLMANVNLIQDNDTEISESLVSNIKISFLEYVRRLTALRGGWIDRLAEYDDPSALSFAIAQLLQVESKIKQELLEMTSVSSRLQLENTLLVKSIEHLDVLLKQEGPHKRFSAN
ncbi:hypothetical protein FIM02_01850 [SAR202 cluster bacterium AD-802-E10_MRT_200m]|nr:hypothetical protein [SAR202 cluster bacterium AD-802-E10_MRT_200m]